MDLMVTEPGKGGRMSLKQLIFSMVLSIQPALAVSPRCEAWFKASKIDSGSRCLLDCATAVKDMGSFDCGEDCAELCKDSVMYGTLFNMSKGYGSSPAERAIALKDPTRSLKAYRLSWTAENLCHRMYKASILNDESDGCRHFVWAALLTRDLGSQFADDLLNAHEQQASEPANERSMDLANNRQGQIALQNLKTRTDDAILESFKTNLSKGRIVILKSAPKNKVEAK